MKRAATPWQWRAGWHWRAGWLRRFRGRWRFRVLLRLARLAIPVSLLVLTMAGPPALAGGSIPAERVLAYLENSFDLKPRTPCEADTCLSGERRGFPNILLEVEAMADGTVRSAFLLFPLFLVPPIKPGADPDPGAPEYIAAISASLRFVANAADEALPTGGDMSGLGRDSAIMRYLNFRGRVAAFQRGEIADPPMDEIPVPGGMVLTYRLLPPGNLAGLVLHRP